MKRVLMLLLALAVCAGAVELYWDDDWTHGYPVDYYGFAVLFHDFDGDGPGDTHGEAGIIHEIKVGFETYDDANPPEFYIYSPTDDDDPMLDELLDGPLAYDKLPPAEYWHTFILDEPVEVPGDFFVVLINAKQTHRVYSDTSEMDWGGFRHSRWKGGPSSDWKLRGADTLLRIEWESLEPAVKEMSWGNIKAEFK